jgi:polysaccharide export outer membrane protein
MRKGVLFLLLAILLSSCDKYLNQSLLLRTGNDYPYSEFNELTEKEYKLAADDRLEVRLFTNDGSGLINLGTATTNVLVGGGTNLSVKIESDGFAKLPLFGRVYLSGLTIRQAEMLIEDRFSQFYNNPFVLLEVTNKRVMIFAGSNTSVVTLENDNTTLFEVLAMTGGLPDDGKADKIKLIRGDLKNPEVFLIDLSTLSGMKNANLVMQANDIIYIETRKGYVRKILAELAPYLAIITTIISTTVLVVNVRNIGGQ